MPEYSVVLVEPKSEGNVGAVARAMENFGFASLVLVNPCSIGDEAEKRAMHALDTLRSARTYGALEDALDGCAFVVGTSSVRTESDKRFSRIALTPEEMAARLSELDGRVALLFGREDYGLHREEIERCDMLVSIPTDPGYPVMNLSHSVAVVLYELASRGKRHKDTVKAADFEKEKLYEYFSEVLGLIRYPEHKREKTEVMFRRLMGRAVPSKWEFHTLMGVFDKTRQHLERKKGA